MSLLEDLLTQPSGAAMEPSNYPVVAEFANDTQTEMRLYLELIAEEVVLSPGHHVSLLAKPSQDLLPITVSLVDGGIQVHPHKEFDPDWYILFRGKLIKPRYPTRLGDHE